MRMKHLLWIGALFLVTTAAVGQETQQRNVGSFSGIKVSEGVDVYVKRGDKESVRVEASGIKLENVITEVSGSYLKIHLDGNNRGRINVKVYVTYVKLEKLYASAAGNIFGDGPIRAESITLQCSSAGNIEIAVDAQRLEASASSAGQIELSGKVREFRADVSSAGQINAYDLDSQRAEVEASSAGSIRVSVESDFRANASSGGSIRFRGNPSKSITNSSSGGSVKKSS